MNEVTTTSVAGLTVTRSTSLKGGVDPKIETNGKDLPPVEKLSPSQPVNEAESSATEKNEPVGEEALNTAVASLNDYVQSIQRDLHFSVDEEAEKTVIRVMDGGSGELIRQIPEEVVLELARKLNDDGEFQLVDALG